MRRSCTAFTIEHFRRERVVFAEIDEVLGLRLGFGQTLEIGERAFHVGDVDPAQEVRKALTALPLPAIQIHETLDRLRRAPRRNLGRDTPERRTVAVNA